MIGKKKLFLPLHEGDKKHPQHLCFFLCQTQQFYSHPFLLQDIFIHLFTEEYLWLEGWQ